MHYRLGNFLMRDLFGWLTFYFLMLGFLPMLAQHDEGDNKNFSKHGLVIGINTVLSGSKLEYRTDVKFGYMYFDNRSLYKSTFEFGTKSNQNQDFTDKESFLSFNISYERLLNSYFSLGTFIAPTIRYYQKSWDDNIFGLLNDDDYVVSLGFAPRFYQIFGQNYLSIGMHLPFTELGLFRRKTFLTMEEPDLHSSTGFIEVNEEYGAKLFHKEVRMVVLYAYRF